MVSVFKSNYIRIMDCLFFWSEVRIVYFVMPFKTVSNILSYSFMDQITINKNKYKIVLYIGNVYRYVPNCSMFYHVVCTDTYILCCRVAPPGNLPSVRVAAGNQQLP